MGSIPNISHNTFPKQASWPGKMVKVCFHYDTAHCIGGTIVRDDIEEPFITIFKLDNGRYVLSTECHYRPV